MAAAPCAGRLKLRAVGELACPRCRSYKARTSCHACSSGTTSTRPGTTPSPESITADIVGALRGRLRGAVPLAGGPASRASIASTLDDALDERRSLVRLRAMRGVLYVVRRDFVPAVHAASSRQVVKAARGFARAERGVDTKTYEQLAPARRRRRVESEPLTLREIREQRAPPHVDLGAVVTLMCAERRLLVVPSA